LEDIARQRRFALSVGIVLFVFSLAGVEFDPGVTVNPLGIPLKILRPDWLLIGLMIASVYAIYRYWLHALFLAVSPMQARGLIRRAQRERINNELRSAQYELGRLQKASEHHGGKNQSIEEQMRACEEKCLAIEARRPARWRWKEDASLYAEGEAHTEEWKARFRAAYPTVFGVGPKYGQATPPWYSFTVPRRSWHLAIAIDFDYLLPIFVNVGALGAAGWRLLCK
jgi:hypothetical protein